MRELVPERGMGGLMALMSNWAEDGEEGPPCCVTGQGRRLEASSSGASSRRRQRLRKSSISQFRVCAHLLRWNGLEREMRGGGEEKVETQLLCMNYIYISAPRVRGWQVNSSLLGDYLRSYVDDHTYTEPEGMVGPASLQGTARWH